MPTFLPNGPFVPDHLVQQLEDDRVVIFCGAGISMGAGLPSYAGLVKYCYDELGEPLPNDKSTEWLWPDRMLGAVENRFTSAETRRRVAERLDRPPTDLTLHRAILRLATIRQGNGLRLVTTNFDTFFEQAQTGLVLGRDFHSGPVLPIPRNDRIASWRSIVYLHGRLASVDEGNEHLVLTSADFGRAYLTEAWAARFVARLFADFTVLFIGYSLNDPVLRYMTDAFAAEESAARGRAPRGPAYIFLPYSGRAAPDPRPWTERKLEPIFYNQMRQHVRLKRTLIAWATARQDYLTNTGVMIARIAPFAPEALHPSDVANLVWAIAGRPGDAGHGARTFAALDPAPPIQWLSVLARHERELTEQHDAAVTEARLDGRGEPTAPPRYLGQLFPPVLSEHRGIDPAAHALIPWLTRQLGAIELADWAIEQLRAGRRPHALLRHAIRERLADDTTLPQGYVRFWRILSAEGDWAFKRPRAFVPWNVAQLLRAEPDAPWSERELAAALRPVLTLSASFYRHWPLNEESNPVRDGSRLYHVADAEVELTDEESVQGIVEAIDRLADPDGFWAARLDLLTGLLVEVLDLYAVAGQAGTDLDPSSIQRPSIEPHPQNHHHEQWTTLFDLIWRGWLRTDATAAADSRAHLQRWLQNPYLAFRRLGLAAIRHSAHFTADEKLEALLDG